MIRVLALGTADHGSLAAVNDKAPERPLLHSGLARPTLACYFDDTQARGNAPMSDKCSSSPQLGATGSAPPTQRPAGDVFQEVWGNLSGTRTWEQMVSLLILLAPTFMPVMALWGADRLRPDEPLLPFFWRFR